MVRTLRVAMSCNGHKMPGYRGTLVGDLWRNFKKSLQA
jgi:hypothetical protein